MKRTSGMSLAMISALAVLALGLTWGCGGDAGDAETGEVTQIAAHPGETIFKRNCLACHTIGEGVRVGPDLQDVHQRREPEWLERWVADPLGMAENDSIGREIFAEFNHVPMAPSFLSDDEIGDVLDYIRLVSTGELVTAATLDQGPVKLTFEYNWAGDQVWVSVRDKEGEGVIHDDKTLEQITESRVIGWSPRPANSTSTTRHTTSTNL